MLLKLLKALRNLLLSIRNKKGDRIIEDRRREIIKIVRAATTEGHISMAEEEDLLTSRATDHISMAEEEDLHINRVIDPINKAEADSEDHRSRATDLISKAEADSEDRRSRVEDLSINRVEGLEDINRVAEDSEDRRNRAEDPQQKEACLSAKNRWLKLKSFIKQCCHCLTLMLTKSSVKT